MEKLEELLKTLTEPVKVYWANKEKRMETGFNLFYLISDYYYRETFHSDIIAAILNPNEKHENGKGYIDLFIDMINNTNTKEVSVNKSFYSNDSKVKTERPTNDEELRGRIDILIEGDVEDKDGKRHCIVIENKLNNAGDTKEQLPKYYRDLIKGFTIDAFVYLPLDPNKKPNELDWGDVKEEINKKLVIIPAYKPNVINLIDNWLTPAEKVGNDDAKFVIRQYNRVLKNLTIDNMDNKEIVSKLIENIDTTIAILKNQTDFCKKVWEGYVDKVLKAIAKDLKLEIKNVESFLSDKNAKLLFERENYRNCFAIENNNGIIGYGIYSERENEARNPLWGPEDRMNNQWPYGYKYLGEDGTKRNNIENWYNISTIEQLVKECRMDYDELKNKSQIGKELIEQLDKFKKLNQKSKNQ